MCGKGAPPRSGGCTDCAKRRKGRERKGKRRAKVPRKNLPSYLHGITRRIKNENKKYAPRRLPRIGILQGSRAAQADAIQKEWTRVAREKWFYEVPDAQNCAELEAAAAPGRSDDTAGHHSAAALCTLTVWSEMRSLGKIFQLCSQLRRQLRSQLCFAANGFKCLVGFRVQSRTTP